MHVYLNFFVLCAHCICMYEGKLERSAVLKAICAGFKETTDPPVCLNRGFQ